MTVEILDVYYVCQLCYKKSYLHDASQQDWICEDCGGYLVFKEELTSEDLA